MSRPYPWHIPRDRRPPPFEPGNTKSKAENLTPEANRRRILGILKVNELKERKRRGEVSLSDERRIQMSKTMRKVHRVKLKVTRAKEGREITEIARTHAAQVMQRLAEIVNNPHTTESAVIAASTVILDRAYGKASQTNINASLDTDGKANQVTAKELDSRIAAALQRAEGVLRGKAEAPKSPAKPVDLRKLDRDPDSTPLN